MERTMVTVRFRETSRCIYMVRLPYVGEEVLWDLMAQDDFAPGQLYRVVNVLHYADLHRTPEILLEETPA